MNSPDREVAGRIRLGCNPACGCRIGPVPAVRCVRSTGAQADGFDQRRIRALSKRVKPILSTMLKIRLGSHKTTIAVPPLDL